jgi:hypothetical protein
MSGTRCARGIGALALAAILAACGESGVGAVGVSLTPRALTGPMADPGTPVIDDDGFAHLDVYPLFVTVRIEASDLAAPVLASWPDEVPEGDPDEIVFDVAVPPGAARRITIEALSADEDGRVATSRSPFPGRVPTMVDVVSGATTDVDVELFALATGTVRASWTGPGELEAIAWIDDAARAVLPAASPVDGVVETVLSVGRIYWPRVVTTAGETIDIPEHVVTLTSEAEIREVSLESSE